MHGKIISRGDFITRRLDATFVEPWDGWLQQTLTDCRTRHGSGWVNGYLTAPLWRFALGSSVCGPVPVLGVMMPSVDRIGRYFPLTLARNVVDDAALARTLPATGDWFERAETVALSALDEATDPEALDRAVQALGTTPAPALPESAAPPRAGVDLTSTLVELAGQAGPALAGISVWWHVERDGSPGAAFWSCGLPRGEQAVALFCDSRGAIDPTQDGESSDVIDA